MDQVIRLVDGVGFSFDWWWFSHHYIKLDFFRGGVSGICFGLKMVLKPLSILI